MMRFENVSILSATFLLILVGVWSGQAQATPVISGVNFTPSSSIWIGESLGISVGCTDNQSLPISSVTAQMVGSSGYTIPTQTLSLSSGAYTTTVPPLYLTNQNNFTVTVTCTNNVPVQSTSVTSFLLSNFTVNISAVSPSSIYTNDQIEIDALVKKNGVELTSGVNFTILRDGVAITPVVTPPYDPARGWIIYLPAQTTQDVYDFTVIAGYDRTNANATRTISVGNIVQFNITSIDKTLLEENESFSIVVYAFDKGDKISVTGSNLGVTVGGETADIHSITPAGNQYSISLFAPELDPDSYTLTATLSYKNVSYSDGVDVQYAIPITGKILDNSGNGIEASFRFEQNGVEKLTMSSTTSGDYNGRLLPGEYDIEVVFPEAKLSIFEADITQDYDDEINYYSLGATDVDGIDVGGLHIFEIGLDFSDTSIEMEYDENQVDESKIRVYRCSSWNKGKIKCDTVWHEVSAYIDTIADNVEVDTDSPAAFAIGTISGISMTHRFDDQDYIVGSPVKISGLVVDGAGKVLGGAKVSIVVGGTGISESVNTDGNGVFTIDFQAPEDEGNFTTYITVEKSPFDPLKKEVGLKVVKNRLFTVVFPDTIRALPGEEITENLKIVNTGQSDLFGIRISVSGVPGESFVLPVIEKLDVGEEKNIPIIFSVPLNATAGTYSGKVRIENPEISRDKVFGFTVVGGSAPSSTGETFPVTGLFTGLNSLYSSQLFSSLVYVGIFAASAFTASFMLKKRKMDRGRNNSIVKSLLSEIKGDMEMNKKFAADSANRTGASEKRPEKRDATEEKTYSEFVRPQKPNENMSDIERAIDSYYSEKRRAEDGKSN